VQLYSDEAIRQYVLHSQACKGVTLALFAVPHTMLLQNGCLIRTMTLSNAEKEKYSFWWLNESSQLY
jgi:hypothetical protein